MATKFKRFSVCIDDKTHEALTNIAKNTNRSLADVSREMITRGLTLDYVDESKDLICKVVREQLEITLKPHIERLASLESKTGHMAATAAFLNVQALMDLVPKENRRDVREMYESARKKAAAYMKTKAKDWDNDIE